MGFLKIGKEKEKLASTLFENVIFSDKIDDITEHWDFASNGVKYDVKGLKKIKRDDDETNEFYHYIEIKNVNGKTGWLYGKADYFLFETNRYWISVSKQKLQNFIKENTKKIYVLNPDEALYCLYKRNGRNDIITLITTIDLMAIATEIKNKNDINYIIGDSVIPEKRTKQKLNRSLNKMKTTDSLGGHGQPAQF
jgi:hypothetical protein